MFPYRFSGSRLAIENTRSSHSEKNTSSRGRRRVVLRLPYWYWSGNDHQIPPNISLLKECLLSNSLLSLLSGGRPLLLLAQKEALTITTCMQLRPAWLQFNFCAQYLLSQVLNFLFRRTVSATRFCYFIYLE